MIARLTTVRSVIINFIVGIGIITGLLLALVFNLIQGYKSEDMGAQVITYIVGGIVMGILAYNIALYIVLILDWMRAIIQNQKKHPVHL